MKVYSFLIITTFLLAVSLVVLIGCKYDVAEPMWDKSAATSTAVTITSIEPTQEALPGVNTITIHGSGFTGAIDTSVIHNVATGKDTSIAYNGVRFNNVNAEVIEFSSTSIKVRRPNLSGDSITVNVAATQALLEVKSGLYKIDPVKTQYGSFVANVPLSTVTVDNAGNLYVVETTTRYLWKIASDGQKTQVGGATFALTRVPSDVKMGPDNKLYYLNNGFPNTKEIRMVDLNLPTGVDSLWCTLNPVKNVICGDFDANGYFYTGGRRSGIVVIRPDRSQRADGYYATDTISNVRVFNGYVYIADRTAIWRHSISDTSKVGAPEQVLDLTQGIFASRLVKTFSFSADGSKMYIGTDSPDPILIATDAMNIPITPDRVDILYKGILPSYCKQFCFGNMLYMISGNVSPAVAWTVYQVDVGTTGAPYY
jgi:hypothetical protein